MILSPSAKGTTMGKKTDSGNNNNVTNITEGIDVEIDSTCNTNAADNKKKSQNSNLEHKQLQLLHNEVGHLKSQLKSVTREKAILQQTFVSIQERVKKDIESSLSIQAHNYESQITELHSVIGELKRQLISLKENRIVEEVEDEDEDARSSPGTTAGEEDEETESKCYPVESTMPLNPTETNADNEKEISSGVNPVSSTATSTSAFQKELDKIRQEHLLIKKKLVEKELQLNSSKWKIQNLAQENHFLKTKIHQLEETLLKKEPHLKSSTTTDSNHKESHQLHQPQQQRNNPSLDLLVSKKAEKIQLKAKDGPGSAKQAEVQTPNQPFTGTTATVTTTTNCCSSSHSSSAIPPQVLTDSIRFDAQLAELSAQHDSSKKEYELEIEKLHYALQSQAATIDILQYNLQEGKELAESLTLLLGKYESYFITMEYLFGYSDQMVEAYDVLVALLESELGQLLANCRAVGIGSSASSTYNGSSSCGSSGIGSSTSPTQVQHQNMLMTNTGNGSGSSTGVNTTSLGGHNNNNNEELLEVATLLQRANENRLVAECAAKALLARIMEAGDPGDCFDHEGESVEMFENPLHVESPDKSDGDSVSWDETASSTKSTHIGCDVGDYSNSNYNSLDKSIYQHQQQEESVFTKSKLNKLTESRIRSLIIQLKTKLDSLRSTLNLNGFDWNLENESNQKKLVTKVSSKDSIEARRNDLEIAILMQELMALKEERAELRSQLYYSEKTRKRAQECLERWKVKEIAYKDQLYFLRNGKCSAVGGSLSEPSTPNIEFVENDDRRNNNAIREVRNSDPNSMSKEKLIDTINKLNEALTNCEVQNQIQLVELSQSNQILADNLNSSKVKYEKRIRKMEEGIIAMVEKYGNQIKNYKQTIQYLQERQQ